MKVLDSNNWIMFKKKESTSNGLITNDTIGVVVSSPNRELNGKTILYNEGSIHFTYNEYLFIDKMHIYAVIE